MPEVKLRCLPGAGTSLRVPEECGRWRCLKVRWAELFLNSCLLVEEQRRYTCCVRLRSVPGTLRRAGSFQLQATGFLSGADGGLMVRDALTVSSRVGHGIRPMGSRHLRLLNKYPYSKGFIPLDICNATERAKTPKALQTTRSPVERRTNADTKMFKPACLRCDFSAWGI